MTQPNPDDQQAPAAKAKAGRPKRGDVVHFKATNTQTGEEFTGYGVVTLSPADGSLMVRPLSEFDLQVDPVDAAPVSTLED